MVRRFLRLLVSRDGRKILCAFLAFVDGLRARGHDLAAIRVRFEAMRDGVRPSAVTTTAAPAPAAHPYEATTTR